MFVLKETKTKTTVLDGNQSLTNPFKSHRRRFEGHYGSSHYAMTPAKCNWTLPKFQKDCFIFRKNCNGNTAGVKVQFLHGLVATENMQEDTYSFLPSLPLVSPPLNAPGFICSFGCLTTCIENNNILLKKLKYFGLCYVTITR